MIDEKSLTSITNRMNDITSFGEMKIILVIAELAGYKFTQFTTGKLTRLCDASKHTVYRGIESAIDHEFIVMHVSDNYKEYRLRKPTDKRSVTFSSPTARKRYENRCQGYVYLIMADWPGNPYKIGQTVDVPKRQSLFDVNLPFEIELTHHFKCDDRFKAETTLHRKYKAQRYHGEWFDLSPEDVEYIKSIVEYEDDGFHFTTEVAQNGI